MSCTMSPLWHEGDGAQDFQFDGAYAGVVSPLKGDSRPTKRQPKRRGLWACFAQPLVDEPVASFPSRASPSRLTLTAQQLAFRRTGSTEAQTQRFALSSVRDVQFKWIQAGGVRVSKVTVTLDSHQDPIVIRGLKNPEDLVDAVRKRQKYAADHMGKLPEAEGRVCDVAGTSPAGRWSEAPDSPAKRLTPRALFADATGSPASAANSGCGSMTLMSAFARSPAQGFAGADSVAREIQLASPGGEELSYTSSSDSTAPDTHTTPTRSVGRTPPATTAISPASRTSPQADPRVVALRAVPPPRQPSDSFVLPPDTVSQSGAAAAAQQQQGVAGSGLAAPDEELAAGVRPTQHSPRGPARPSPRTAGGSPPPRAEDSVVGVMLAPLTPEGSPLMGGSPPPRAEDSMPEGASVPASVQGSPSPAPPCIAGGNPPPVPEDSVVMHGGGVSTPVSPLSSNALGTAGRPLSPGALGTPGGAAARLCAAHPPPLQAAQPADPGAAAPSRSTSSGSASISAAPSPSDQLDQPDAEVSFSDPRVSAEPPTRGSADPTLELPHTAVSAVTAAAAATESSDSPAQNPRLLLPSLTRQRQHEGSHRLAHNSMAPPAPRAGDHLPDEAAVPVERSDGGGSSFKSASSGELTDSSSATATPPGSPPEANAERVAAAASSSSPALAPGSGASGTLDRRSTSPMGILGIAAMSATLSAVLTSAGLGGVGLAAPSLAGTAGVAVASSTAAAASVAVAPLTLLGLTAAAAVTMVAAAAVTHIRTGSPLRPLESPYTSGYSLEGAAPAAEPLLAARAPASAGQVPESPVSWFGGNRGITSSCGKSVSEGPPGSARSAADAAAGEAQSRVAAAQVPAVTATVTIRDAGDDDSASTALLIDRGVMHLACASPAPGLASEPSLSCDGGGALSEAAEEHDSAAGCLSAASGASGATATSGSCDGSEGGVATSGAWGSQPALPEFEAEQAALASQAAAAGAAARGQAQPSVGGGGGGAAAAVTGPDTQHSEAEEEALPVMLFSEGPGGMPPLALSAEQCALEAAAIAAAATAAQDAQVQQQSASVRGMPPFDCNPALASSAEAVGGCAADGGHWLQPATRVVHGGELRPPPPTSLQPSVQVAAEPEPVGPDAYAALPMVGAFHQAGPAWHPPQQPASRRDPTVRQLFRDDDASVDAVGAPGFLNPASGSAQWRHQQQQEGEEEAVVTASSCAPLLRASPPLAENPSPLPPAAHDCPPPAAASPTTRQRRTQHLTESPVRVLYSVHAAFTGLPSTDPRVRHVQWGLGSFACESTAQADVPLAMEGRSRSGDGDGAENSSGVSAADWPYNDAAQPLAESAMQRVFALNSQQAGASSGGGTAAAAGCSSTVSIAVGAESPQDDLSPPQAGAQDWYMSSLGVNVQLGSGFELAAASLGQERHGPPASPSTADGSAHSSPAPSGSSPAASPALAEDCAAPQASQYHASRGSAWSQPASRMPLAQESTQGQCRASIAANEEVVPLLGYWRSEAPNVRADAGQLARERGLQHGGLHSVVDRGASPSRSTSPSRTLSPSASGSSVPPSASLSSGLYTPMLSDASSSKGAAAAPLGHSPASTTRPAAASTSSPLGSERPVVCVIGRWRTPAAAPAASVSVGAVVSETDDGVDPQRRLLTPGVRLPVESPPTPWTQRNPTCAAFLQASSPSVSNAQDGNAQDARAVSTIAAEQALPPTGRSDTADDLMWLLRPVAGGHAGDDEAIASAPASPRIPPPPPLAHSNTISRGGSARSRRMTGETEGSLGGAAGCCSSRRSSSGSCADQADPARLAWCVSRGSPRSFGAHGGLAQAHPGPALESWSDGNQLATTLSAAERGAAAHPPGLQARGGSSSISRDSNESSSRIPGSSRAAPGSSVGPTGADLQGPLDAVNSRPGAAVTGCSGSPASSSSQTSSSPPHTPSGALGTGSQAAASALSPDLSEISSVAYAGGAYVYGSPYGSPATDTADGFHAGPDAEPAAAGGSSAVDGGEGDDLFHNPLYSAPGKDTAGKSPGSRPPRDSSGCIALPLMPYSEILAYGGMDGNGGGTSTCTNSPDPASISQPNTGSELPSNAGRRRTREETATSSYSYDDGSLQRTAAGQYGTGAGEARSAASRQASADGGDGPSTVAAAAAGSLGSEWGTYASPPEDITAVEGGGGGAEAQPLKRARTQLPQPEVTAAVSGPVGASLGPSQQQLHAGWQASTPAPPQGPGGAAPAPGLPLVSPLMVLNPTYSQSAGGSPAVTSSPPAAARSDDTSAARADATPRHGLAVAAQAEAAAAAGRKGGGDGGVVLAEESEDVDRQLTSLQTTPRNRELAQLQEADWGSSQGSPSSQQAAHAAVLLRHANDAVDFARDAVQRGDEQWLSRVTATLQAVQSALDALHEF